MHKMTLVSTAIASLLAFHLPASAQTAQPSQTPVPMHKNMPHAMPHPPMHPRAMNRPPRADFPSPEALAKMTPPEPMTEEKIKQRFAMRKAKMTEMIERDRKSAKEYAEDFERYQQHRSEQLKEMMSRAEQRREQMLKRLDEQEQHALERFRQRQQAGKATATQGEPAKAQ